MKGNKERKRGERRKIAANRKRAAKRKRSITERKKKTRKRKEAFYPSERPLISSVSEPASISDIVQRENVFISMQ